MSTGLRCGYFRATLSLVLGGAVLFACSASETPSTRKAKPSEPGGDFWLGSPLEEEDPPIEPTYVNEDSGAFSANARGKDGGARDANVDAGAKVYCTGDLTAGDLAIVELLISSRAGVGDEG